ncbi:hypothetical protein Tco_0166805, partial [Tanacetum coccineum]
LRDRAVGVEAVVVAPPTGALDLASVSDTESNLEGLPEEDPSGEDSLDEDSMEADEPPPDYTVPAFAPQPSPIFPAPLIQPGQEIPVHRPYRTRFCETCAMHGQMKTVHPLPTLPPGYSGSDRLMDYCTTLTTSCEVI